MSVLCGWASIDERGRIKGGKAGDQTGREVKVGPWYYFGQSACLRWKNSDYAKEYAKVIKALCKNEHVGYDQNQRTTLFNELKKHNWDYKKISKNVECDCSELIACGINCVLKSTVIPSYIYTGNLTSLLMNSGYFKKLTGSKYYTGSSFLRRGDILNASGHHVISVLEDGSRAGQETSKVAIPPLHKGSTGSEVKKLQSNLNTLGIKDSDDRKLTLDGIFGASTKEAVKNFQDKYHLQVDGYYGNKSYEMMKTLIK